TGRESSRAFLRSGGMPPRGGEQSRDFRGEIERFQRRGGKAGGLLERATRDRQFTARSYGSTVRRDPAHLPWDLSHQQRGDTIGPSFDHRALERTDAPRFEPWPVIVFAGLPLHRRRRVENL